MEKRIRSPNYPAISLKQAVARTVLLYRNQHRHAAPREVLAKGLGFQSLSGAAATVISSLSKYGLLDRDGDGIKISERAMQILHPHSEQERAVALRAAAMEPQLFAEINERFPVTPPSDDLLANYLLRKNFSPTAVKGVIESYKETLEFVESETAGYDSHADFDFSEAEREMARPEIAQALDPKRPHNPPSTEAPAEITMRADGSVVVAGTLKYRESIKTLIAMLTMIQEFAPPKPTEPAREGEEPPT